MFGYLGGLGEQLYQSNYFWILWGLATIGFILYSYINRQGSNKVIQAVSYDSLIGRIAEEYFREKNKGPLKWNFFNFEYNGFIKPKKINNARKEFAPYDLEREKPVIIADSTILNDGKLGVLITDAAVYYKLANLNGKGWVIGKAEWNDLQGLSFEPKAFGSYLIINGSRIGQHGGFSQGGATMYECEVINDLFSRCVNKINLNVSRNTYVE